VSLSVNPKARSRGLRVVRRAQAGRSRSRLVLFLRNTVISIAVLLGLLVGGGVAYTWYMGQQPVAPAAVAIQEEKKSAPAVKPTAPSPTGRVSASVQMLTSPVLPGENASITVRTNALAKCTIKVEYNKVPSTDSGLMQKAADEFGMVTWAWSVPAAAPLGKWPVKVTCANEKNSAMVQGDLVVKK